MNRFNVLLPALFITLLTASCNTQNNASQTNQTLKPVSATSTPAPKQSEKPAPTPAATPTPVPTPVPTPTPLPPEQRDFEVQVSLENGTLPRIYVDDGGIQDLPLKTTLKGGKHTFTIFELAGRCKIFAEVVVNDEHTTFDYKRAQCP